MFVADLARRLIIDGNCYRFAEHPVAPGRPYAQTGRAATVYQLHADNGPPETMWKCLLQAPDGRFVRCEAKQPLGVGRAQHHAVVFSDPTVDLEHAWLQLQSDELLIFDHDSRHGTFVNGVRVPSKTWVSVPQTATLQFGSSAEATLRRSPGMTVEPPLGTPVALKVFSPTYRVPGLVSLSQRLQPFAAIPALQACARAVLVPHRHGPLLLKDADLLYAVLMPWIQGSTWVEKLLDAQPVSYGLSLAQNLGRVLADLEQRGIAHCDLSGSNLMLPTDQTVALVDFEQLFGPGLDRPHILPAGSPGYAHRTASQGLWSAEADRFAGGILLAEVLGFGNAAVAAAAWGESYFTPTELQTRCSRYELLASVLERDYGSRMASLFERVWDSEVLAYCPTFGDWMLALMSAGSTNRPAGPVGGPSGALEPGGQPTLEVKHPPVQDPMKAPETRPLPRMGASYQQRLQARSQDPLLNALDQAALLWRQGHPNEADAIYQRLRIDAAPELDQELRGLQADLLTHAAKPAPGPDTLRLPRYQPPTPSQQDATGERLDTLVPLVGSAATSVPTQPGPPGLPTEPAAPPISLSAPTLPALALQPRPASRARQGSLAFVLALVLGTGLSFGFLARAGTAARLEVEADVPGAHVSLDGADRGVVPLGMDVPPGSHRIEVAKDGFEDHRQELDVVPGTTLRLQLHLPPRPGTVTLDVHPDVLVDIRSDDAPLVDNVGSHDIFSLSAGQHHLEVRAHDPGLIPFVKTVDVLPGKTAPISATLSPR